MKTERVFATIVVLLAVSVAPTDAWTEENEPPNDVERLLLAPSQIELDRRTFVPVNDGEVIEIPAGVYEVSVAGETLIALSGEDQSFLLDAVAYEYGSELNEDLAVTFSEGDDDIQLAHIRRDGKGLVVTGSFSGVTKRNVSRLTALRYQQHVASAMARPKHYMKAQSVYFGIPTILRVSPTTWTRGTRVTVTGRNLQNVKPHPMAKVAGGSGWAYFLKISDSANMHDGLVFLHVSDWRNSSDGTTITFDAGSILAQYFYPSGWSTCYSNNASCYPEHATLTGPIRLPKPMEPGTATTYEEYYSIASPISVTWTGEGN